MSFLNQLKMQTNADEFGVVNTAWQSVCLKGKWMDELATVMVAQPSLFS